MAGCDTEVPQPGEPRIQGLRGRGISVCAEWRASFQAFLAHIGTKPARHLTLERVNNDGNYEPGNVKWATRSEQVRNTRRSKKTMRPRSAMEIEALQWIGSPKWIESGTVIVFMGELFDGHRVIASKPGWILGYRVETQPNANQLIAKLI